jgi:type IV pilus assembly protein PilY1
MTVWCKRWAVIMLWLLVSGEVGAVVSQMPLTGSTASVAPNLMFTLDDSGSMEFECVPDQLCYAPGSVIDAIPWHWGAYAGSPIATYNSDVLFARRIRSSAINPIYYNPEVRYQPWIKSDGSRYPEYSVENAPTDPNALSIRANLVASQIITAVWAKEVIVNVASSTPITSETIWPAQYYQLIANATGNAVSDFTQVFISPDRNSYPRGPNRSDCAGSTCTFREEAQNFSNWFTYARNRLKVARGGTAEAFGSVPSAFRVGFGTIGSVTPKTVDGVPTKTVLMGVRPFSPTNRQAFYDLLFSSATPNGTPLRRALDDVGQYFSRADSRSPWAADPEVGESPSAHQTCRRSFHVLLTDGMWNSDPASTVGANQDVDSLSGSLMTHANGTTTFRYTPVAPYRGPSDPSLADVAMYYWNTDLRTDLKNDVPASNSDEPNSDPAFWQHLVNFTIGLGIRGNRRPEDWPDLLAGSVDWGFPRADDVANADDLWHAAVNSRGRSASVRSASEYTDVLKSMISTIVSSSGREAGVAVSARSYAATTVKYIPSYKPGDWTGEVEAQRLSDGSTLWSASKVLPAAADRSIYTLKQEDSTGVPFTAAAMSSTTQAMLGVSDSAKLINYVRGDRAEEKNSYRKRTSVLGDIVNSTPILVKDLVDSQYDFLSSNTPGQSSYLRYVNAKKYRVPQLFAGANDGMLHAFNGDTGAESFAFIPRSVLGRLKNLANPAYEHQYFVDGPLTEIDIYDGTDSKWRNVVVGSGGAGAKNLFAINVPVPSSPTSGEPIALTSAESAPASADILWEINSDHPDYSDLGNVLQAPEAGIMQDGTWVVLTGNGYDSASGLAKLYVIDARTGARIKVLTATGISSNGLGGVKLVRDRNKRIVAAYAGDLSGYIWKFDFSSTDRSQWRVAFAGTPLFLARNSAGQLESFTAAPTVVPHPLGGVMVLAGTGKLFESDDASSTSEKSLYGIWDKPSLGGFVQTNQLVAQTIQSLTIDDQTGDYFSISSNGVDYGSGDAAANKRGWMIRMTIAPGQRLIYAPQIESGRAIFDTIVPGGVATGCTATQPQGYTFVLDPFTGAPGRDGPTFDTNNDTVFTSADNANAAVAHFSSIGQRRVVRIPGSSEGRLEGPGVAGSTSGADSSKKIKLPGTPVRRQWRQIATPPSY